MSMARSVGSTGAGGDGSDALLALAGASVDGARIQGAGRASVPGEADLAGADEDGPDRCPEARGTRSGEPAPVDLDSGSRDARAAAAAPRPRLPRQATHGDAESD